MMVLEFVYPMTLHGVNTNLVYIASGNTLQRVSKIDVSSPGLKALVVFKASTAGLKACSSTKRNSEQHF
jgi:hypothetical protein